MTALSGNPMFALLLFIAFAVLALKVLGTRKRGDYSFTSNAIMSPAEIRFFRVLQMAAPNDLVFPQVSMAAVVRPNYAGRHPSYMPAFRSISQKRIDFVVCDRESLQVRCLVELDDSTHDAGRDRNRDAVTAGAGYRTVRVRASRRYDIDGLRRQVLDLPVERTRMTG
jgi:hypothetical protein